MNYLPQNLEIHIHKMDGSIESFIQSEASLVKHILDGFHPARIFTREKIIVSDGNSLSSFPACQVVRLDLVSEPSSHIILPAGIVDAVEITKTEYQALLQNSELGEQWNQARANDATRVVYLDVEMAGQQPLFLALEIPIEQPAVLPEVILYPLYPFASPALCFRMHTGGIAALNLIHLIRFTLFPAPQQTPMVAWPAHWAKSPQLKRPDLNRRRQADNRPLQSDIYAGRQTNPISSRRSQNENASTLESKH